MANIPMSSEDVKGFQAISDFIISILHPNITIKNSLEYYTTIGIFLGGVSGLHVYNTILKLKNEGTSSIARKSLSSFKMSFDEAIKIANEKKKYTSEYRSKMRLEFLNWHDKLSNSKKIKPNKLNKSPNDFYLDRFSEFVGEYIICYKSFYSKWKIDFSICHLDFISNEEIRFQFCRHPGSAIWEGSNKPDLKRMQLPMILKKNEINLNKDILNIDEKHDWIILLINFPESLKSEVLFGYFICSDVTISNSENKLNEQRLFVMVKKEAFNNQKKYGSTKTKELLNLFFKSNPEKFYNSKRIFLGKTEYEAFLTFLYLLKALNPKAYI